MTPASDGSGKENVDPAETDGAGPSSRPDPASESSGDEEPVRTGPTKRSRLVSSDDESGDEHGTVVTR